MFLAQLLSFLGIEPKNNLSEKNCYFNIELSEFISLKENYTINKADSYLFSKLLGTTIDDYTSITFNKETRSNMLEILFEYLEFHFQFKAKQISSHKIFKTIFS